MLRGCQSTYIIPFINVFVHTDLSERITSHPPLFFLKQMFTAQ